MFRVSPFRTSVGLVVLFLVGCAVNPATGRRELSLVSESQEIQMGKEADPAITAQMGGLYPDEELQAYFTELGESLAAVSERPELPWSFKVLDDDLINAFALPGGFVYVTRGIMSYMNSEAELVGVLGHEVGHVTARHTAGRITRQQVGMIGLVTGAVFSETVRDNAGAAMQGMQLLMLRHSRGDESESDALGYRYMTRANYNPQGISDVMKMLQSTSPSAEEMGIPTWMLSHPDPGDRVEANEARLAKDREAGVDYSDYTDNRERFLSMIDGMVFGKDPAQGYFIDTRFLHPELTFEITFPAGWGVQNGALAVQAGSPERDALMGLTFSSQESAEAAMDAFMGQEGVTPGRREGGSVNGVPAIRGRFSAQTQDGVLEGTVMFAEYGGAVYQIIGYGPASSWNQQRRPVEEALASFAPLTDRRYLDVSPHRIRIVTVPRTMTVREFLTRYPSTVDDEEVLLANQVTENDAFSGGQRVKQIVGGRIPSS